MSHFGLFQFLSALFGGAMMLALPHLSPRRYFFAVTVPPDFRETEPAQDALRRYRLSILAATIAAAAGSTIVFLPMLPVIVGLAAYLRERSAMRSYAVRAPMVREAELTGGPDNLPWWTVFALPPLAGLGAVAWHLRSRWDEIPARFPVHWGIDGQPDRWATKSAQGVYAPLLFGTGMMILLLAMGVATFYGARRAPHRVAFLKIFLAITWLMGFIFGSIALMPVVKISPLVLLLPAPFFVIAALWWTMRAVESDPGDPTPDECWHFGDFYYNPADPALFVQKRMGWGYTFNFANRLSWLILGGFLAGVGALILLLPR
jgi:uncharacterized membrane protein